jgi:hypothetical protein
LEDDLVDPEDRGLVDSDEEVTREVSEGGIADGAVGGRGDKAAWWEQKVS